MFGVQLRCHFVLKDTVIKGVQTFTICTFGNCISKTASTDNEMGFAKMCEVAKRVRTAAAAGQTLFRLRYWL